MTKALVSSRILTAFFVILFIMSITHFVYRFPKKNTEADLPSHFTYPFYYQAHPLAVDASVLLQEKLTECHPLTSNQAGRMYGVLVVKDAEGKLGYLTASSDNANDTLSQVKQSINFVPAIYRALLDSGFEKKQQALINDINAEITALDKNPDIAILKKLLQRTLCESDHEIQTFQTVMRANKKSRHHQREHLSTANLSTHLSANEQRIMSIQLARESVNDKKKTADYKTQKQRYY
jgi:tRNA pseudouridine32 synthase/23S rRNA pseudouridine746 synthase